jgi:uncharacterized protein YbjT (DUF2867 family)
MKTAIVIGATGLVGTQLVHLLLADTRFEKVVVFTRRSLQFKNEKLEEHIIDFNMPDEWQHLVKGDVFFSALGTTIKQAGGKKAQYKIDYTYQFQFAQAASYNNVPVYVLVSAASASQDSRIFYSRMKGELERDVKKLPFKSIYILQPGLLYGNRQQDRPGEKIGYSVITFLNRIGVFRKYRPIAGRTVAQAMLNSSIEAANGVHIYTLDRVFHLAEGLPV